MTIAWTWSLLVACVLVFAGAADASAESPQDGASAQNQAPYKFGVFPYLAPLRLEAIYAPIGKALSQAIGRPVQFRTASRFELFFAQLKAEKYDIAFIQPFWYVKAADQFGYLPLARIEKPLTAMIVVLDDSAIRSPEDLRGKTIATPPPFGPVTRMATRALKERGLVPGRDLELKSFKSVDSCYQQLAIGSVSACLSGHLVRREVEKNLKVKLRVLMETPGIPSLVFVAHSRVPAEVRAQLRDTIVAWGDSEAGRTLARGTGATRFVPAEDTDYDVVRALLKEIGTQ